MAQTEKISISLTGEMAAMVRAALRVWRIEKTAGDVLIDAIGVEEVRRLWNEGIASGPATDGMTALKALRARYES